MEGLRSQMINGAWCNRKRDGTMGAAARSDLQHLLVTALHLLDLLPGTSLKPSPKP